MNIKISEREIFINHQVYHRSGHMGHAMVDAGNGRILDFYSNCDGDRVDGHSGYGWMEYRISDDYGKSFGDPNILDYSRKLYEQGIHTAICEKAIKAPNGNILLFFQITDASKPISCEPWSAPTMAVSTDNGETFSMGKTIGVDSGRIYDVISNGKSIFIISQSNDASVSFLGNEPEHVYKLYRSDDSGETFYITSILPIDAMGKGYGALEFMENGTLIAYVYDSKQEDCPEYVISEDDGITWSTPARTKTEKRIRNPQLLRVDAIWFLLGRNGGDGDGLVLYASDDGIHWNAGKKLDTRPANQGTGYYSNMLLIREPGKPAKVLIQYSHVYEKNRVNIAHRTIEIQGA